MKFPIHGPRIRAARCVAVLAFLAPASAGAIANIRSEHWRYPQMIVPPPGHNRVSTSFEADLTERDFDHGVELRIDSTTPLTSATTPVLQFFRLVPALLPGVETAWFFVDFDLACDPAANGITILNPECWMQYNTDTMYNIRVHIDVAWAAPIAATGTFGFVTRDESMQAGDNPLASDQLFCSGVERSIGVYFDPQGTLCHGSIHPGLPGTVYILAKLADGADGISGAEFRFSGAPASWQLFAVPNPTLITIGDPFRQGVSVGFPCQRPQDGIIPLYTVLVLAGSEEHDLRFEIVRRDPPSNPGFQCPIGVNCNAPIYTAFCVEDVPCTVNASQPTTCGVPTAVVPRSWSSVKALFR